MFFLPVGSTYSLLKRALDRERDRDVLRLIPFTCVDTFRGHLEEVNNNNYLLFVCSSVSRLVVVFVYWLAGWRKSWLAGWLAGGLRIPFF